MAAKVSASAPKERAFKMALSKSCDSKKASKACGTLPWQVELNK